MLASLLSQAELSQAHLREAAVVPRQSPPAIRSTRPPPPPLQPQPQPPVVTPERRHQSPSKAEIELEKMKEEKRQAEMKALKDEMIALRQGGAASPEVKMLKDELAEMRRASMAEQEDLRQKLSSSLGGTSDLTSDPGLATVRR